MDLFLLSSCFGFNLMIIDVNIIIRKIVEKLNNVTLVPSYSLWKYSFIGVTSRVTHATPGSCEGPLGRVKDLITPGHCVAIDLTKTLIKAKKCIHINSKSYYTFFKNVLKNVFNRFYKRFWNVYQKILKIKNVFSHKVITRFFVLESIGKSMN